MTIAEAKTREIKYSNTHIIYVKWHIYYNEIRVTGTSMENSKYLAIK